MTTLNHSALGKTTPYPQRYDPSLLFAIPRAPQRQAIGVSTPLPFTGVDIWNAYELSWLDPRGKPVVALAELRIPADSPFLIESKSLKLYLNSLAQERLDGMPAVTTLLCRELTRVAAAPVQVRLYQAQVAPQAMADLPGLSIDTLDLALDDYGPPKASYLHTLPGAIVTQALVSDLLRSNCPVTGQPDWGSIRIAYRGSPIDPAGLLRYLVSFRTHSEFHEHCVERIYMDLLHRCAPQQLSVYARYTRRGGLDINPFRSNVATNPDNRRGARQ